MINLDTIVGFVVGGFCTGLGSAVGVYLANRGLIKHLEKVI